MWPSSPASSLVTRLSHLSVASQLALLRAPPRASWLARSSSSSSASRWKQRQGRDVFARNAKVQGLKSRAAFKLLEIDAKYRLFKQGQTVVDLGYAPGSWSQVAVERTRPHGRVIGIDLIPARPPQGVATFQGDFLSPVVQKLVKEFILRSHRDQGPPPPPPRQNDDVGQHVPPPETAAIDQPSYIDMERRTGQPPDSPSASVTQDPSTTRLVDVRQPPPLPVRPGAGAEAEADTTAEFQIVLSDMSAPWGQTSGFSANSLSNPYDRLMNTSGVAFRDHAGSMDLCAAALQFASDTLKPGGHLICKFYQGSEDKALERKLKRLFNKVYREKPESSRSESKEAYFIALRRRPDVVTQDSDGTHIAV